MGVIKNNDKMYFPLVSPVGVSNGNYLLVASNDGKNVICIKDEKLSWEREFDYSIKNININKAGYATIIGSNNMYKSIITVISDYGEELFNIYVSSNIVIKAEVSPDCKKLAIIEVNTSKPIVESVVRLLDINNTIKDPDRSVEKEYTRNKLIVNMKYKSDGTLVTQYSDKIISYNLKEATELVDINENVEFVDINSDKNIIFVEKEEKKNNRDKKDKYKIKVYNTKGKQKGVYIIGESLPKNIIVSDNVMVLNLGQELRILSTNGREKKKYISTKEIRDVILSDDIACILYKSKISLMQI